MSNHKTIAVNIIRDLVSRIFKIDPRKVHLATSEISPEYRSIYSTLSGGMWDSEGIKTLWGFSPTTGFKEIPEIQYKEWNVSDGIPQDDRENTLCLHEVEGVEQYIFFLEKETDVHSVPSNGINRNDTHWTLFKSPNFKEYWNKIKQQDIERWSSWLN